MKIAVSAESTVDLEKDQLLKYDIQTLPYSVYLGDEVKMDGEITNEELIDYVNEHKVLPKTGAVNREQFAEHFKRLRESYDAVVHFTLSSHLSSAYENAVAAAKEYDNIYIIDSKSLSTGIGLLAIYARKLANEGLYVKEIYEKCLERVPFVQVSSELKRVDFLYKGGRCSMLAMLGANLLKIRPQIVVKDGKLFAGKKYRGKFERVVEKYCLDTLEEFNNPDLSLGVVAYTTASEEIINIAVNALKEHGFKEIMITHAGSTVTSHCGEECVGIYYINDGGKKA